METIDVVTTWVDGNDPKWLEEFYKYRPTKDSNNSSTTKFRDWDTLRFVFRGIEEFMPWVRKIHFVTYGHIPKWMNIDNPKLHIVTHKDIFDDQAVLPTYNSNSIEFNFLNIDDLAEQFIYFNDDTLVLQSTPSDRMFIDGKPRDFLIQTIPRRGWIYYKFFSSVAWRYNLNNNIALINKNFDKKESIKKYKECYYNNRYGVTGNLKNRISNLFKKYHYFEHYHQAQPFLKSVWQEAIDINREEIDKTISHRFRDRSGITAYLFRYWHLVSGNFIPIFEDDYAIRDLINIDNTKDICNLLLEDRYRFVCLNDESHSMSDDEFMIAKKILTDTLDKILPNKSTYEI